MKIAEIPEPYPILTRSVVEVPKLMAQPQPRKTMTKVPNVSAEKLRAKLNSPIRVEKSSNPKISFNIETMIFLPDFLLI